MKKVLLIGDLVGHEKIAISAMIPILSNLKCDVNNLLTSIVSNTFDYGKAEVVDLTDYMRNSLDIWKELNFKFDYIFTGYLTSMDQVRIIEELIEFNDHPLVITDPIMGDDGSLYIGVDNSVTSYTKEMVDHADIIIPNLTEAAILLGDEHPEEYTEEEILSYLDRLSEGKKTVLITSVSIGPENYVYGINHLDKNGEYFKVKYELIPYKFAGTGDIFSALVLGKLANDLTIEEAVEYACNKISEILKQELVNGPQKVNSVHIEKYLKNL